MKKSSYSILIALTAGIFFSFMPGDKCTAYAPSKPGTELEYRTYSAKDKPEGWSKTKVLAVKDNGSTFEMSAEAFDKKDKPLGTSTYEVKCIDGVFTLDMQTMLGGEQKSAFKDMKLDVQGDKLDIPAEPSVGQALKNGSMKMKGTLEGNPFGLNLTMNVTNRKVEAIEDVTVPAGTFKAVKITYDMDVKMVVSTKMKGVEWHAKDVGLVRSEAYDKNGKLQSYTVLSAKK